MIQVRATRETGRPQQAGGTEIEHEHKGNICCLLPYQKKNKQKTHIYSLHSCLKVEIKKAVSSDVPEVFVPLLKHR